jgi:hypothetical protein
MARVNLGIYASAAASLVVAEQGPHSRVASSVSPAPDRTQINSATEGPKLSSSAVYSEPQPKVRILAPMIERWTRQEKTRYRRLVVKSATSDLSQAEKQELDSLELARTQFEDARSPEEIFAEFRTRKLYANLLASLKDASI